MAAIKNIEGLSPQQVVDEVNRGGKFVMYQYCISIILMTFKQPTDIYFMRAGESGVKHHIGYTIMTFLLGWWGIPWGPIYTIGVLYSNLSGGKDITPEVMNSFQSGAQTYPGEQLEVVDIP